MSELSQVEDSLRRARKALARVRYQHQPKEIYGKSDECQWCDVKWPCPTYLASKVNPND